MAVVTTPAPAPGPPPTPSVPTTFGQVIFYHDNVATASGSYDVDYYYAGCVAPMDVGTGGITDVVWTGAATAEVDAIGVDAGFFNTCGIDDIAGCPMKTTYQYVIQKLDQITDSAIKTMAPSSTAGSTTTTVKFCIRHRMLSSTGQENGYKQADVTFRWTKTNDGAFSGSITTDVNDAGSPDLDVGTVAMRIIPCAYGRSPPSAYAQGEVIELCLTASAAPSPAAVTIVRVNTLQFWIDIAPDGTNGVYDVGETVQAGMVNGLPVGTTTILPPGAGTGNTYCSYPLGNYVASMAGLSPTGCILSAFLAPEFFVPGASTTIVRYAGTATIEFGDGNNRRRRVLSLRGDHHHRSERQVKVGEQFDKSYTSSVMITSADDRNDGSTCSCSGFILFKIICWFIKCMLGFK
jgi:hypothetical protein